MKIYVNFSFFTPQRRQIDFHSYSRLDKKICFISIVVEIGNRKRLFQTSSRDFQTMLNNDGIGLILNNQKLFTRNAENLSIMEMFVGDVMYNTAITSPKILLSWVFLTFIIFHFISR